MSRSRPAPALDTAGPGAPPRANGELVFSAPWESRAFGLALALRERGCFEWEEFRQHLIAEIAAFDRAHPDGQGFIYYACWLRALERLLVEKGLCRPGEIESRVRSLAAREPGHDHPHPETTRASRASE